MKVFRSASAVLLVAVLASGCKKSSGPTTPEPSTVTVSGTLVNVLTNLAVSSATLRTDGVSDATSGADGRFSITVPDVAATRTVTITSDATVSRTTFISTPGSAGTITLIPSSFDLGAFDQMFRSNQAALRRWTNAPALIIQKRTLRFGELSDNTAVAESPLLTDDEVNQLVADFTFALPQLTGNTFTSFSSQGTETATPGDIVAITRTSVIFAARYQGLTAGSGFAGYTRWTWNGSGQVVLGTIMLDQNFETSGHPLRRALRSHELGHALSYNHVTGRTSLMNPTVTVEPTIFDRDGAKIAFSRPLLNRTPDIDQTVPTTSGLASQLFTAGAP